MNKKIIINIGIIVIVLFAPLIPFKELDYIHGGNGGAMGLAGCFNRFYSVSGLVSLYAENKGRNMILLGGTKKVPYDFFACYRKDSNWPY